MLSPTLLTSALPGLFADTRLPGRTGASDSGFGAPSLFGPAAIVELGGSAAPSIAANLPRAARQRLETQRQRELLGASAALLGRQFDRAARVAMDMLRRDPNDADAAHMMARVLDGQKKFGEARRYYERAAQAAPGNESFRQDAENARILAGSRGSALSAAERMLRNPAQRDQGLRLLSDYDLRQYTAKSALEVGDVLMKFKSRKSALDFYSEALARAGKDDPALSEIFDRAQKMAADSPDAAVAHKFVGDAAMRLQRYDDAISAYTLARATEKSGDPHKYALAAAYNARGERYLRGGQKLLAAGDFQSAFGLDPSNPLIFKNYNANK